LLLACALLAAVPALGAPLDALTGEPIPAAAEVPAIGDLPPDDAGRDGDLELISYLAEGTSKNVRALPGGYVVWQNGAWLEVHDVADPTNPVPVGRYLLPAQPSDLLVDGTWLYVALRKNHGLLILDYANPASPTLIGALPGYDLLSVAVGNQRAYCGVGSAGFLIVDLADPANPTAGVTFDTPGSANGTAIAGNLLAVALGASGLGLYDVANPAAPVALATAATSGFCTFVQIFGDRVYAAENTGLRIFDVAVPAAPVVLGSYNAGGSCYELVIGSNPQYVYLAGLPGLFFISVADPTNPALVASVAVANGMSCHATGNLAFLAARYDGLRVFDAADLAPRSALPNAGFANKLHLDDGQLYVADLSGGVRIYDLSDPLAPVFLAEVATDPSCQDLRIAGDVLYSVNSNNSGAGLVLTDVSAPAAPVPLSTFDTTNSTAGLDVAGGLAILANGFGGLRAVDVGDPLAPALLGDLVIGSNAVDVQTSGAVAFATSFGGGMLAVDIADPAAMTILDQEAWGFLNALDLTGTYAWVADGQAGLRVVDVTDPANLASIVTFAIGGQPRDVVKSPWGGPYVYLGDDFYGLRQVDVSDPANPILFGSYPSADRGMGVDAQGGLVVLAAGETGVYIYRDPAVVAIDDEPGPRPDDTPARPDALALAAAPNPFNPRLEVSWALPRAGAVRLDVFDARGRLVRTLLAGQAPAGAGSLVWNGDDDGGRAVPSGVYHLRLSTGDRETSRSVTLVR